MESRIEVRIFKLSISELKTRNRTSRRINKIPAGSPPAVICFAAATRPKMSSEEYSVVETEDETYLSVVSLAVDIDLSTILGQDL